jgi:transposase
MEAPGVRPAVHGVVRDVTQDWVIVINDLEGDPVLWVGDHRIEAALREFWESRPSEERRAVRAVIMDMWILYRCHSGPRGARVVVDRVRSLSCLYPRDSSR